MRGCQKLVNILRAKGLVLGKEVNRLTVVTTTRLSVRLRSSIKFWLSGWNKRGTELEGECDIIFPYKLLGFWESLFFGC